MTEKKGHATQDGGALAAENFRVGVRVPPFNPEKPGLWFHQMEAQFVLANIKVDETKFFYIIGHLDPQYADEVEDIIANPPATEKYTKLKSELINRLSASREKKVMQLLMHEELGDRKPSQFYRHLLHLAGPGVPEEFLRTIWTSRLPAGTQAIVASQSKRDLAELAELADRIHDVVGTQVASTAAITTTATSPSPSGNSAQSEIAALTKQVAMLAERVERLSRPRGRSSSRTRHRSNTRSASSYKMSPLCWYHQNFGERARKCVKPCDYPNSGNVRGNQ
ncbi:uncharacterized protein LOC126911620 [Spodoptera frugiperda]|uniref:Uncharacterized protein LOC126911620 n=1 Tax=Spodoptera frugiperda TaxID=7108 RepID=A0A9R0DXV9_SPOFR|nr:uncharacterized protein LOC126911620 [Spodoptera frugiperda]